MPDIYPYTVTLSAQAMPQGNPNGFKDDGVTPNDPGWVPYPYTPGSPNFLSLMGPYFENYYRSECWQRDLALAAAYKMQFSNFLVNYEAGRIPDNPPIPPAGWELQATRLDPGWAEFGHTQWVLTQTGPKVAEIPQYPKVPVATPPPQPSPTGPGANYMIGDKINAQAPNIDSFPIGFKEVDSQTGYTWQKGVGMSPFGPSYYWVRIA